MIRPFPRCQKGFWALYPAFFLAVGPSVRLTPATDDGSLRLNDLNAEAKCFFRIDAFQKIFAGGDAVADLLDVDCAIRRGIVVFRAFTWSSSFVLQTGDPARNEVLEFLNQLLRHMDQPMHMVLLPGVSVMWRYGETQLLATSSQPAAEALIS